MFHILPFGRGRSLTYWPACLDFKGPNNKKDQTANITHRFHIMQKPKSTRMLGFRVLGLGFWALPNSIQITPTLTSQSLFTCQNPQFAFHVVYSMNCSSPYDPFFCSPSIPLSNPDIVLPYIITSFKEFRLTPIHSCFWGPKFVWRTAVPPLGSTRLSKKVPEP